MLAGIHSVVIWTDDVNRLLPFYRDALGLRPEMESDGFVVFQASSGGQLSLGTHSEVEGLSRDPYRVMIDFEVDDCREEYERLRNEGVEFIRPPSKENGVTIATFRDPDGNLLQLFETE